MSALIVRVMAGQTPEGGFVRQLLDSLTFDQEVNLSSQERTFHLALLARSIPTAGWLASMIRFSLLESLHLHSPSLSLHSPVNHPF